jgi:PiT family inorganic phosphate transporter
MASVHWDVIGQMVTAWIFTIPSAAVLGGVAWEISDLFGSSTAGSVVIAVLSAALAFVIFRLAQRNKITPEELDRTHATPDVEAATLGEPAAAMG